MEALAIRFLFSLLTSAAMAIRALRRKSVDISGVLAGIPVMIVHMMAGYRFAALLLVFFFTSSKLTKVGEEKKRHIDAEFKEGGQRNWIQVLANSAIATILVIVSATMTNGEDRCLDTKDSRLVTGLIGGIIGHYACCNGDTWSSEIGLLSSAQPRLITTFKTVKKGTNGAISPEGLMAAAAGGFVIGMTFVLVGLLTADCTGNVAIKQLLVLPIASVAGLCGSLIDSLFGATLQFSGYCTVRNKVVSVGGPTVVKISGSSVLNNNQVNACSILLTTLLTSIACISIF
ncbi:hypothetical protein DsansV1_C35g0228591 [Dioscorea sansibarensis]